VQEIMMARAIVDTTAGTVRGTIEAGVRRFRGVPYAAAPVGDRRFAAPAPAEPWEGVRDAVDPGPNAPHRVKAFPGLDVTPLIGSGWVQGDDYLSANIWTPEANGGGRPVMVWIHGGGFVIGSKDVSISDGAAFARAGLVCFAINYRMGIDGFLPIPGVPTNLGLRDMIAALQWVRANAAAFGGDPRNITVFGESAGAMAIADLIASPLAKGLFRRAIIQSGHAGMTREIPVMQRLVKKLAKLLRVTPDRAGFASVAPGDALDAVEQISAPTARIDLRDSRGHEPMFGRSRFVPVHGDDVLPLQPLEALRRGAGSDVEVLIGTNAEEMNLFLVPSGVRDKIGGLLATFLLSRSQPGARRVLKAYGLGTHLLAAVSPRSIRAGRICTSSTGARPPSRASSAPATRSNCPSCSTRSRPRRARRAWSGKPRRSSSPIACIGFGSTSPATATCPGRRSTARKGWSIRFRTDSPVPTHACRRRPFFLDFRHLIGPVNCPSRSAKPAVHQDLSER
jgi:para-nitrobenzyl esterase